VASEYFAGAVIIDGDRVLVVDVNTLVPDYITTPTQTKFPGGKEDPVDGGDPFYTAIREVHQETGLEIPLTSPREILCKVEVTEEHFRIFYLIRFGSCRGEVKKTETLDEKSTVSAPRWVPIEEVGRELYWSHQPALLEILNRFPASV
jgi:8-oxo-dGTP pyrophosphatase MutT (NUDIX family)